MNSGHPIRLVVLAIAAILRSLAGVCAMLQRKRTDVLTLNILLSRILASGRPSSIRCPDHRWTRQKGLFLLWPLANGTRCIYRVMAPRSH